VPNRRGSNAGEDDEGLVRSLLETIMDLGVPNAGACSRNVGDCPK